MKRLTKQERQNQEAEWFEKGRLAGSNGASVDECPEDIAKRYSNEWYRCRAAWRHGRASHYIDGLAPIEPVLTGDQAIEKDLTQAILQRAPINMRKLSLGFSSAKRAAVQRLLEQWIKEGGLKMSGKGTRGSPLIIEGISME